MRLTANAFHGPIWSVIFYFNTAREFVPTSRGWWDLASLLQFRKMGSLAEAPRKAGQKTGEFFIAYRNYVMRALYIWATDPLCFFLM
jgi:hypothetical protein